MAKQTRTLPNVQEYLFMQRDSEGLDTKDIYAAGDSCFAEGWIDEFGIITPKGQRVIYDYEKKEYR
jgi:hypothetical protein